MERAPNIAVYPPAVSVAAPLLAVALEWAVPLGLLPAAGSPAILLPGIAVLGGAGLLAWSGVRAFQAAETNVDPRRPALALVRGGPFRVSRNPMYLGMVLFQIGLALTFSLDWALPGALGVWAFLHFGVVLREEAYLTSRFGQAYRDYLAKTRRWL
ncbi:methyltransferase family protein [Cribrihabitans neustonicus]|uniref:methyltransferase family protein n=1 Tax=Cribrihabitans neustonicus TaxID=1429085 RepID=UPI003B58C6CB